VIARQGTIVWPFPAGASVTLATNHCAQEIAEAIIRALAPPARSASWRVGDGASASRSRA
jgi:N-methylhydantoinase B